MPGNGPFQIGTVARINWEILLNAVPVDVVDARIQRIIMPDQTDMPNFPRPMYKVKKGLHILETVFNIAVNYTAILQAEYGNDTIETISEFVVEKAFGFPVIEISTNH